MIVETSIVLVSKGETDAIVGRHESPCRAIDARIGSNLVRMRRRRVRGGDAPTTTYINRMQVVHIRDIFKDNE